MNLYKQIQKNQLDARKIKNQTLTNLLTTLLGDIQNNTVGQSEVSDDAVLSVIKTFITSTKKVIEVNPNEKSEFELNILESYLPKHLEKEELENIVSILKENGIKAGKQGGALIGYVMTILKNKYSNRYDATEVRQLLG